jgi:hypothetical protein
MPWGGFCSGHLRQRQVEPQDKACLVTMYITSVCYSFLGKL